MPAFAPGYTWSASKLLKKLKLFNQKKAKKKKDIHCEMRVDVVAQLVKLENGACGGRGRKNDERRAGPRTFGQHVCGLLARDLHCSHHGRRCRARL